jgi:Zn-dependent protease
MYTLCFVMFGWIFSLCLHEYAHARVAYAGGDTSVEEKGYLSLNPLRYAHPFLSFVMPVLLVLIGGLPLPGGAVYINEMKLKSRWWSSAVSAAGPAANAIIAIVIAIAMRFAPSAPTEFWVSLALLGQLQVAAVLWNLLPVPPFDGFGILAPLFTREDHMRMKASGQFMMLILFMVFWQVPGFARIYWAAVSSIGESIGISSDAASLGYQQLNHILPW